MVRNTEIHPFKVQHLDDLASHSHLDILELQPAERMASGTATEECENKFSSPCLQVGCLHDDASPSTVKSEHDKDKQGSTSPSKPDPTTTSPYGPAICLEPLSSALDPLSKSSAAVPERVPHIRPLKNCSNARWDNLDPDKYVLVSWAHREYDEHLEPKKVISENPVLITDLHFTEQSVAYEALLLDAPPHKVQEYYGLQLLRLKEVRKAIDVAEIAMDKFRKYRIEYLKRLQRIRDGKADVHGGTVMANECKDQSADCEEEVVTSQSDIATIKNGHHAYVVASKKGDKFRAYERMVMRLLKKCEDAGEGKPEFQKVVWQAS